MITLRETILYPDKELFRIKFINPVCSLDKDEIELIEDKVKTIAPKTISIDMQNVTAIPSLVLNRFIRFIEDLKKSGVQIQEIQTNEKFGHTLDYLKINLH